MIHPYRVTQKEVHPVHESPVYTKGRIMEALTSDERIAEHDIKVYVNNNDIVTKGEVFSEDQRNAINQVIHEIAPKHDLRNQIVVRVIKGPEGSEAIR